MWLASLEDIAVVLMDVNMPRLDGYEAARAIHRGAQGGEVVLIALTGWGADEERLRSREVGFDRHLVKPAAADDLRKLLGSPGAPVAEG